MTTPRDVRRKPLEKDRRNSTTSKSKTVHHQQQHRHRSYSESYGSLHDKPPEEERRVVVELMDIDYRRETFTFSIKVGLSITKLEEVLRKRTKHPISDEARVLFYHDGNQLDSMGLFQGRGALPTIFYRVVNSSDDGSMKVTQFEDCESGYTLSPEFLDELTTDIATGITANQFRNKVAEKMNIEDPNRIVLLARGGLRPGAIEGTAWEMRQLKGWICREITIDVCSHGEYMILRGHGGDYLYQPDRPDGRYTEAQRLKIFVRALVRGVHHSCNSKISIRPEEVKIIYDGRVKGARSQLLWGRVAHFQLPDLIAEAFDTDQTWWLPTTTVCTVCGDDKRATEIPQRITTSCDHKPTLCKDCLRQWIQSSLESSTWDKLKCPECPVFLRFDDVNRFATRETFARYDDLATRAALKEIPNFRWCLAPKCQSGQIYLDTCPRFRCKACGYKQCIKHDMPWHSGETCEEYDKRNRQRRKDEKASEKIIKETSKNCPQCKKAVHKYFGCNHITCVCRHEWCYICLAPFQRNEHGFLYCRHNPGCTERDPFLEFVEGPGIINIPGLQFPPREMRRPHARPPPGVRGPPPPPPPGHPMPPRPPPPPGGRGFDFDIQAHFGPAARPPANAEGDGNNDRQPPRPAQFPFQRDPPFFDPALHHLGGAQRDRRLNDLLDAAAAAAVATMRRHPIHHGDGPRHDPLNVTMLEEFMNQLRT